MRVNKTRLFAKFARRERISDAALVEAIARAHRGLLDADLGGGLIEQRVARQGGGRSGGYRTLIAVRFGARAVFLFGFANNDRDNVSEDELAELRVTARSWLAAGKVLIERALEDGALIEVEYDGANQNG